MSTPEPHSYIWAALKKSTEELLSRLPSLETGNARSNVPGDAHSRRFSGTQHHASGQAYPRVSQHTGMNMHKRVPHIAHPLTLGTLSVLALGTGAAFASLRSSRRTGRSERISAYLENSIASAQLGEGISVEVLALQVREGFGKPDLISVDIVIHRQGRMNDSTDSFAMEKSTQEQQTGSIPAVLAPIDADNVPIGADTGQVSQDECAGGPSLASQLLPPQSEERMTRHEELTEEEIHAAHVVLRSLWDNPEIAPVSICLRVREQCDGKLRASCTDLGCETGIVQPTQLYEFFGAPASDRLWHP
ncbi:hypothetical protein [Schaalia sp. lx-260]|uniref:hypothetical protein n=1 Tax=Schaalia sp. lx-260 TaxID=2899082 RepID=UPI001E33FB1F|nr:hypothetical protein [Schaalia sp. lx-260]MCD4550137.1 hypothetical protein [Schaalia sp. lx-260]